MVGRDKSLVIVPGEVCFQSEYPAVSLVQPSLSLTTCTTCATTTFKYPRSLLHQYFPPYCGRMDNRSQPSHCGLGRPLLDLLPAFCFSKNLQPSCEAASHVLPESSGPAAPRPVANAPSSSQSTICEWHPDPPMSWLRMLRMTKKRKIPVGRTGDSLSQRRMSLESLDSGIEQRRYVSFPSTQASRFR